MRDAAAYVCWAFARAYESDIIAPAVRYLAPALLAVACYDREVGCYTIALSSLQDLEDVDSILHEYFAFFRIASACGDVRVDHLQHVLNCIHQYSNVSDQQLLSAARQVYVRANEMGFPAQVNCRRAASAAFQESVGRLGNFPHGIDIVAAASYFSLASRQHVRLFLLTCFDSAAHT